MPNQECLECRGCWEYYCTWCEEAKCCPECIENFCENCSDDFQECEGCKKKICEWCIEDFAACDQTEDCSFTACEQCMAKHEHEHEDDQEESK